TLIAPSFSLPTQVEKTTVPLEEVEKTIPCEVFSPDFPNGDCNYHNLIAASDGSLYFTLGTHAPGYAARFYRFDPKTEEVSLVAQMDAPAGEDAAKDISQGKIHTRFFEDQGKLWFASHTSFYEEGLPGTHYDGKTPHKGGRFMNYDLKTGEFQDLAKVLPSEGIISMTMDKENDILYGITWPSGLLVSYSVPDDDLRTWGAVQNRGEWGHHPWDWDRICRTLGIDPEGHVYGSTMDGEIWKYDRNENRRVSTIEGLDLSKLVFSQSAEETNKGDFQNNWRVIEWNPETKTFWGILFETTTLFEFDPEANYLRAVTDLRPEAYRGMPRNPETSQLGFAIGPKNTIYYLCHGPAIEIEGKPEVQSSVHLMTYEIDKEELTDHGPLLTDDQRRPFFTESIAIGPDDHIYTVAWVEVTDPERKTALLEARISTGPAETEKMVYE
ncbi:MAG: hypothetical protein KC994_26380, partial [Candidatus Omnitrophica bacterium]|nr:hypothetical protein [Candidatus Omnitrophota bacterium]